MSILPYEDFYFIFSDMSQDNLFNNTKSKVLVTGGAGYVGSVLIPMLLDNGYQVCCVDNLLYRHNSLLFNFRNPHFEFVRGDVRREEVLKSTLEGIEYIVHLAALVGDPACKRDPESAQSINFEATKKLNDLRSKAQKIIFASTGSVYGHIPKGLCTEETPTNPISIYAITKLAAEKEIEKKGNYVIYRFATAFGLSHRPRLDLMINDFVYKALYHKFMIVYEKSFKRTFIHVYDMARSLMYAIDHFEKMKDQIYNVGNEGLNFTKADIVSKIQEHIPDFYVKYADGMLDTDQRNYAVDYSKIRSKGFETTVAVDDGVQELIRGYKTLLIHNPFSNVDY